MARINDTKDCQFAEFIELKTSNFLKEQQSLFKFLASLFIG